MHQYQIDTEPPIKRLTKTPVSCHGMNLAFPFSLLSNIDGGTPTTFHAGALRLLQEMETRNISSIT